MFGIPVFLGALQLPLRTSKYFKPSQRQHYANEAELEKPLKCSPPGGQAVFDGALPVAINDYPAVSCFVLSESMQFAITVNLCLIKSRKCTALNLAVYVAAASRRGSSQTFAKDLVSLPA